MLVSFSAGVPFVQIAIGNEHSSVTLSLLEMEAELSETAEDAIRKRLPQESLMNAGIVIEPDYCLARWIRNECVVDLARWLYALAW